MTCAPSSCACGDGRLRVARVGQARATCLLHYFCYKRAANLAFASCGLARSFHPHLAHGRALAEMRAAASLRPLIPAVLILSRAPPTTLLGGGDDDGGLHSLLLQRAIQTCCKTARLCRDPPTAEWLSDLAEVSEMYHGIEGFPPEFRWRSWMLDLLAAPPEEVEVVSVLKKYRGVSAENPYLQPEPMSYTYELRPPEVVERVMQTMIGISREWCEDLALMEAETEGVWRNRRAVTLESTEELRQTLPAFNLDPFNIEKSPYRAGSYDLLLAAATRQAVLSTLASMASPRSWAARDLLEQHCEARTLFAGELERHAADAWLASLLELPIALRMGGETQEGPALVDPRGVVEQVLEWRAAVAEDWIRRLERVPDEILEVKREHVSRASGEL